MSSQSFFVFGILTLQRNRRVAARKARSRGTSDKQSRPS
jgi:hypothetical protein